MKIGLGIGVTQPQNTPFASLGNPSSLFVNAEQGAWYDPSDLTTLYQDSAGTTPVTAVEQPVGLMLDKSKGLVLGPELVTNGEFISNLSGWVQSTPNYWTWIGGRAYHANSTNYNELSQTFAVFAKPVQIEFDYECLTATNTAQWFYINAAGIVKSFDSAGVPRLSSGIGKMRYVALDGIQKIGFSRYSQAEFYVDNISVRELPGNHAFQTTSANRPVLSARVNKVVSDLTTWSRRSGMTVTKNADDSYDVYNDGAGDGLLYTYPGSELNGASTVFRAEVLAVSYASGSVRLNNGIYGDTLFSVNSSGFTVCQRTAIYQQTHIGFNVPTGTTRIRCTDFRATNTGVNLPAYQRVNTSTDYDTQGFPLYLRCNGTSSAMQTNSINFTNTDKMTVWAGVRKLSDAANAVVTELSSDGTINTGIFNIFAPVASSAAYRFVSKGTSTGSAIAPIANYPAPSTAVLTGVGSISADVNDLRVNGTLFTGAVLDQGTGNYGNYPLFLFARAGTSLWFNGNFYGLIVRGAQTGETQLQLTEKYLNDKTKAFDFRDVTDSSSFRWNSATASPDAS